MGSVLDWLGRVGKCLSDPSVWEPIEGKAECSVMNKRGGGGGSRAHDKGTLHSLGTLLYKALIQGRL